MRYFVTLIFILTARFAYGQSQLLDSLYAELERHPREDTLRAMILIKLCYPESLANPEKSKVLAENLLTLSEKIGYAIGRGDAFRYLAEYYLYTGDHAQAVSYAFKMRDVFEKTSDALGHGQSYQLLARIKNSEDELESAKSYYLKAIAIFQKANMKKELASVFNGIGVVFAWSDNYDSAAKYYEKSLKVREEINDEPGMGQIYGNLAYVYQDKKNYAKAIEFLQKSLVIRKKFNNKYGMTGIYAGLGRMHTLTHEYDRAEFYLKQSLTIAQELKNKKLIGDAYGVLTFLEKERKRFEQALTYSELNSKYNDSLYTEKKAKQIAEMEARYETAQKDHTIELLKRDQALQRLRTQIVIASFVLIIITLVAVYFQQRKEERKNRKILNLQIDNLIQQHRELAEKYKNSMAGGSTEMNEPEDQRLFKKIMEVIEARLSDPLFDVNGMAEALAMSRSSLNRKVKAITGFSPNELVRTVRLRRAAQMLLQQSDSVTQISLAVGFDEQSYFSKAFKKEFGVPPSEYLKSVQSPAQVAQEEMVT